MSKSNRKRYEAPSIDILIVCSDAIYTSGGKGDDTNMGPIIDDVDSGLGLY